MVTRAKTVKAPSNEGTHPILAFNEEGQIDVFLFNDTSAMAKGLGLDVSVQIPLSDLANANMLYHISQELKLTPGEETEDDKQIIDSLTKKISDNITNKDEIVAEIIASWNTVASQNISQQYSNFKLTPHKTRLAFQGAYELTLREYVTGYITKANQQQKMPDWILTQAAEILESTRDGRAFSTCRYERMNALLRFAEECKKDIESSRGTIDAIKSNLERENGKWFTTIQGLIGFEIEMAIEEAKEAEQAQTKPIEAVAAQAKLEKIRTTLKCLLNNDYTLIPKDEAIEGLFEQAIKLSLNPLSEDFYNKLGEEKPSAEDILHAIKYVIRKTLKEQKFSLDPATKAVDPILALADSTKEDDAENLVTQLLDEQNEFPLGLLKSILHRTKNETIREIVSSMIESQPSLASLPPVPVVSSPVKQEIDLLKLADSRKENDEESLLSQLLDERNNFSNATLKAIHTRTTNPAIFDVVASMLASSGEEGSASFHIPVPPKMSPLTTHYDHHRKRKTTEKEEETLTTTTSSEDLVSDRKKEENEKRSGKKKVVITLV
ncbi:MAG: hypothetical protein BGO43_02145 [Gammaproteobacteria bacterium 39-13]|nr:hypothetical protein [Gammaproteobacteria bacterium]OJV87353.1 MAG: hypothetical protein BGO43_02145 [Gammaproteobacteria bacterium 39-13]